jgi:SAM-dependent methyltransferase
MGTEGWQAIMPLVAERFNREYRQEAFDLPEEVQAMAIFSDWVSGALATKVASPFWQMAQPQKNQRCLDIGCGVSFLIYPWCDWQAYFYGYDISTVARDLLNSRAPQLNSKLFKGVQLGPAHRLDYEVDQFDLVIATGWSCYFGSAYWRLVLPEVRRVIKPSGKLVFDVLDPDTELAENWAILETYLGAEVFLDPLSQWQEVLNAEGAKLEKRQPGPLFQLWQVRV